MENFKKVRDAYYEKDKPGNLLTLHDQLTDTEADVDVLADVYGFKEIQGSRYGKCLEENLEEMNSLFEKLSEKFEQMERKVGKPWKYKCFNFVKVYALLSLLDVKSAKKCYILESVKLVWISNVRCDLSSMFLTISGILKVNYVHSS